jgi:hypothetical protein
MPGEEAKHPAGIVYDSRRLFLIVNGGLSSVEVSRDFRFQYDPTSMWVRSRVAVACPTPASTIRKLTVAS